MLILGENCGDRPGEGIAHSHPCLAVTVGYVLGSEIACVIGKV